MKLKYGLISADSHAQLHKDAFTCRMSHARFGDRIPHVIETTDKSMMAEASDLLAANGIAHAAIDADTLGIVIRELRRP